MPRKSKITQNKEDKAYQRKRTAKLIEQTKDVDDLNIEAPSYFSNFAKSIWKKTVPILQTMKTVKKTDMAIVEAFCLNYEIMVNAYQDIQEHGQIQAIFKTVQLSTGEVLQDKDGNPKKDFQGYKRNPSTQIFDTATAKIKALASELGLTPTSRASLINALSNPRDDVDLEEAMKEFFE